MTDYRIDRRGLILAATGLLGTTLTERAHAGRRADDDPLLRANYLITVADDFIVDVYYNGQVVPDSQRTLRAEIFGATVEQINVPVYQGDWFVFNVVNNRMRWGGAYYFAAAGCFAPNEFGFVSRLDTGEWSASDNPRHAARFISDREYLQDRPALPVERRWDGGDSNMRAHAGGSWDGVPVWGTSRNTWLKVIVA